MQQRESRNLTQGDLVKELHRQGRVYVSLRDVATWRRLGLLPEFDAIGQGRGRGAGRAPSVWTRSESVLNQAAWIHDLRSRYRKNDGLYLPLWMLGYPVPLKYVRKAISGPLNKLLQSVEEAVRDAKTEITYKDAIGLQDVLEDEAVRFFDSQSEGADLVSLPLAVLDALLQLLFNSDYNLDDTPFEEAVIALKEWEVARRKGLTDLPESGANIFEYAPLFKQYFSLEKLREAVRAARKNDFIAVQRDLGMIREITAFLNRALSLLFTDAPPELKSGLQEYFEHILPAFFNIGRWFILADLSLRWNGYGERIDESLSEALNWIRREFNEEIEQKLMASSAEFVAGMQGAIDRLMPVLSPKAES